MRFGWYIGEWGMVRGWQTNCLSRECCWRWRIFFSSLFTCSLVLQSKLWLWNSSDSCLVSFLLIAISSVFVLVPDIIYRVSNITCTRPRPLQAHLFVAKPQLLLAYHWSSGTPLIYIPESWKLRHSSGTLGWNALFAAGVFLAYDWRSFTTEIFNPVKNERPGYV